MNKAKLKTYAPQARKDFIAAVVARANLLGISDKNGKLEITPSEKKGDVTLIAGQAWTAKVHDQRERLIKRMQKNGFGETAEAIAYTWFNRFAALRYMEIHDYLGHGHRVLSSREGGLPEILTQATELAPVLPGLNATQVADMKLAGNKDGELYRLLLVAQCNALSSAMPFLFERIDDETELLLPDNLLRTDSIVAKLVAGVPEEDWAEVEIIGWLYQFYISEKKDQVIGKVVKSEDIPAATQLFTPNWIVQYLLQNSVGRLWLMANPQSTLAKEWPYYITPAEQTPEVQAQLDALIQTRIREDGDTLNPESITVLDPACGSGHILVVAYDVLKAIYLERGYQARAIPRLILEKNLYGLDIDDRAAQMAGFALLMKARADDRRLFTATDDTGNLQPPKLNVLSLQESKGLSVDELATHLAPFKVQRATITSLMGTFEYAKTFGSLIQIPDALKTELVVLPEVLASVKQSGDMYASAAADDLLPLVQQAQVLAMQFDAVVANPPYMGSKYLAPALKTFLKDNYNGFEKDLFSAFMVRDLALTNASGQLGFMSPFVWMFLSSYEELRLHFIDSATLTSLVQLEYSGFDGATVPICTFTLAKAHFPDSIGTYVRLSDFRGADQQGPRTLEAIQNRSCGWFYTAKPNNFKKVPGSPIAYWISDRSRSAFSDFGKVSDHSETRIGLITGENQKYIRFWHEVSIVNVGFGLSREGAKQSGRRWFPQSKGGDFRRWYGNNETVVDWKDDGNELQTRLHSSGERVLAHNFNLDKIFEPAITWTKISSGDFSVRLQPRGFLFNDASANAFVDEDEARLAILGFLGTKLPGEFLKALNPTLNFLPGNISSLPVPANLLQSQELVGTVNRLVDLAKSDWDAFETSWDFKSPPLVMFGIKQNLKESWEKWQDSSSLKLSEMKTLEEENNRIFINAYGLQDELSPEVPESQITLARSDREKDSQRLISYTIGCMMGRYSLDEPGLIYAHSGNVGFEPGRYATFPADADGIVPVTDELWFADDACSRIREFLRAVWGPDTLEENMAWLAESLGTKATETPDETIRRYVADKFFKDHLQTYKKRPIYWLFSSGKQGAFQALVYLHRYHEGTLARMRAEYVVPLTGKMQSRIEMLEKDRVAASSTAARNKIAKQIESLKKKYAELLAYDEKLRHYADMRITLDLDDGVKVNYGKFGDLLAEVKAVTGGASDD
jgi:hypothetical protein